MIERKIGAGAGPFPGEEGRLFISGMNLKASRSRGRALFLQGERTTKALNSSGTRGSCRSGLPGGYEVYLSATLHGWGRVPGRHQPPYP